MDNIMTVDVEDWYQTHDYSIPINKWDQYEDRVEGNTGKLLDLLSAYHIKATFFVLGCVARSHPGLVKRIAAAGHEVGSHGGWHQMVRRMTREEFRQDLRFSRQILEDITGKEINMYRAPIWSVAPDALWALPILEEEGFICDSSIQPFRTPFSGLGGGPTFPFRPVIAGRELKLIEVPPTSLELGCWRLAFAGGLYLRLWPVQFLVWALKRVNRKRSGMVYIHPWELDPGQPRLPGPLLTRLLHYTNISGTEAKLERLFREFSFIPLGRFIEGKQFPAVVLEDGGNQTGSQK